MKYFYHVDDAIVRHDYKIITSKKKKEGDEKPKKIKTKPILAQKIFDAGILKDYSFEAIYTKLTRYEKNGFKREDIALTQAICKVLGVTKEELVFNRKQSL